MKRKREFSYTSYPRYIKNKVPQNTIRENLNNKEGQPLYTFGKPFSVQLNPL